MRLQNYWLIAVAMLMSSSLALAEIPEYNIVIKDHKFQPAELVVPVNTKIRLIVENQDATPEEFESDDLHREKIIAGNKSAKIMIGPLKPGRYPFVGEFHEDTAKGTIVAQ
jgi:plastocyanin